MPQIVVGRGVMPCQVDDFPEKCERSRQGSIYFRPGSSEELTDGELEHIKVSWPELYAKLAISKPLRALKAVPKMAEKKLAMPEPVQEPEMKAEKAENSSKKAKSQ